MSSSRTQVQVIGAGLPRTGTLSQRAALQQLLGSRCYHMAEVPAAPHHLPLWLAADRSGMSKELADKILADYGAGVDYPVSAFYRELSQIYPNAKVILSVRDPGSWAASVSGTVLKLQRLLNSTPSLLLRMMGISQLVRLTDRLFTRGFGQGYLEMDEQQLIGVFERHCAAVRSCVPQDRLLEFRVSDGWAPLCDFLGVQQPQEPFPNVNDSKQFQEFIDGFRRQILVFRCLRLLLVASAAAAAAFAVNRMQLRRQ